MQYPETSELKRQVLENFSVSELVGAIRTLSSSAAFSEMHGKFRTILRRIVLKKKYVR
jgi:hypothetical protein